MAPIKSTLFLIFFTFSYIFYTSHCQLNKQNQTHLHFYFHDILSGRSPTAVKIVGQDYPNSGFGTVMMADDPLTDGPDRSSSKLIGRAQGLYACAAQQEVGLLMVMNFVFLEGEFNGSALSVLGRNMALQAVREMPIVGGTGAFRFATGYALAMTHWMDAATGDATVEYDVFVMH